MRLRNYLIAAFVLVLVLHPMFDACGDEPSPAAAMINLLKANKLPPDRLGNIVKLACQRGDASDLAYIFAAHR